MASRHLACHCQWVKQTSGNPSYTQISRPTVYVHCTEIYTGIYPCMMVMRVNNNEVLWQLPVSRIPSKLELKAALTTPS